MARVWGSCSQVAESRKERPVCLRLSRPLPAVHTSGRQGRLCAARGKEAPTPGGARCEGRLPVDPSRLPSSPRCFSLGTCVSTLVRRCAESSPCPGQRAQESSSLGPRHVCSLEPGLERSSVPSQALGDPNAQVPGNKLWHSPRTAILSFLESHLYLLSGIFPYVVEPSPSCSCLCCMIPQGSSPGWPCTLVVFLALRGASLGDTGSFSLFVALV